RSTAGSGFCDSPLSIICTCFILYDFGGKPVLSALPDDAGAGDVAGALAVALEPLLPAGCFPLAPTQPEPLPELAASPAACLHRSDKASWCSLRQATIRPPPGCTPAQSFFASSPQAARTTASWSLDCADCAAVAGTLNKTEEILSNKGRRSPSP